MPLNSPLACILLGCFYYLPCFYVQFSQSQLYKINNSIDGTQFSVFLFWILKIKSSLENVIKVLFKLKKIDTLGIR